MSKCDPYDYQCNYNEQMKAAGGGAVSTYCYTRDGYSKTNPPKSPVCTVDTTFDQYGSKNCISSGWRNSNGVCCESNLPSECKAPLPPGYTQSSGTYGYIPPGEWVSSDYFPGYQKKPPPPAAPKPAPKPKPKPAPKPVPKPKSSRSSFGAMSDMSTVVIVILLFGVLGIISFGIYMYIKTKKTPLSLNFGRRIARFGTEIRSIKRM